MSQKVINIISVIIAIGVVGIVLYIHVFPNNIKFNIKKPEAKVEKNENETQIVQKERGADDKINEQEEKAKKDIESAENISDENLQTKISFIEEYTRREIEELDEEIILSIAYNASYLKNLKNYSSLTESPFFELGEKTSEYAKGVLTLLEGKNKEIENKSEETTEKNNLNSENEENNTDEQNENETTENNPEETISIGTETVEKEKVEALKIEIKNIMNEINKDRTNQVKEFAKTLKTK